MTKIQFRILLITSVALTLVARLVESAFPSVGLEEAVAMYYSYSPIEEREKIVKNLVLSVFALIHIAGVLGLFMFKGWGRYAYSAGILLAYIMYSVTGLIIYSGPSILLYQLSILCSGAVIALSFGSSVAEFFKNEA